MASPPPLSPPASLAVIGLGNMGIPMAVCLTKAGFHVVGFDLSEAARTRFESLGGRTVATADEAVSQADAVITLLPNGKIVRTVLDQVTSKLKPGALILEMSSSDPLGTRDLGNTLIAAGFEFIDAPVSGGVKRAGDGTLAIMVGGDARSIDRADAVLTALGRSIFRTGALGSGHAMKALNNYVSAAGLLAVVEAMQIGAKFGLDQNLMADVLNASSGRNNTTEVKLKPFIISGKFDAGFPIGLMAKDVRTADDLGRGIGVPRPLADVCADIWEAAAKDLGGQVDHTAIGLHIEKSGQ